MIKFASLDSPLISTMFPLLGPLGGGGSFDAIGVLTAFGLFTSLCHRQLCTTSLFGVARVLVQVRGR